MGLCHAALAQLVERRYRKPQVASSTLASGSEKIRLKLVLFFCSSLVMGKTYRQTTCPQDTIIIMKQLIALIEVTLFISTLLGMLFFNISNSDIIIIPAVLIIGVRLIWLLNKKALTINNFQKDGLLFSGFVWYGTVFILALVFLIIFKDSVRYLPEWLIDQEPIWFSLLHTGGQELIFRVFLLSRLQLILSNQFSVAIIGGLLFGLAHLILPNALVVTVFTSILGIAWCCIYQKYPNFILVCLSHGLLNIIVKYLALQ